MLIVTKITEDLKRKSEAFSYICCYSEGKSLIPFLTELDHSMFGYSVFQYCNILLLISQHIS